jgi:dUTP pyrophosphatase
MDNRTNIKKDIVLMPQQRTPVGAGLFIELPVGFEAQIKPRSGLGTNKFFGRNNRRRRRF